MKAERVRKIRKALRLTQERFAQLLGVSWTTVHRWEAGSSRPTGMGLRMLVLVEGAVASQQFRLVLSDPRASDPMFLMYRLLGTTYGPNQNRRGGLR